MKEYFLANEARKISTNEKSKKEFLSSVFRQWWHIFFDHAPELIKIFPPDGKVIMEEFLAYSYNNDLFLDWKLHLELYLYILKQYPTCINREILKELIVSSIQNWIRTDFSENKNLLIYHNIEKTFFLGKKSPNIGSRPELIEFKYNVVSQNELFQNETPNFYLLKSKKDLSNELILKNSITSFKALYD